MPRLDRDISAGNLGGRRLGAPSDGLPQSSPSGEQRELAAHRTWVLKRARFLRGAATDPVHRLLDGGVAVQLVARQLLFEKKDPGDAIYVVERGRLKLSRFDERGREITLAILERGEFFGEEGLEAGQLRDATAVALEPSTVVRIDREHFEHFLVDHPQHALEVARELRRRWVGATERLEHLAFEGVPARLARLLLALAESHGEHQADGSIRIGIRLTHQELSSLVIATRETLSKTIASFRSAGWIRTDDRSITVLDSARLRELTEVEP